MQATNIKTHIFNFFFERKFFCLLFFTHVTINTINH